MLIPSAQTLEPIRKVPARKEIFGDYPNIAGSVYVAQSTVPDLKLFPNGAFKQTTCTGARCTTGTDGGGDIAWQFSAMDSNALFGASDTVHPEAFRAYCLIRYL